MISVAESFSSEMICSRVDSFSKGRNVPERIVIRHVVGEAVHDHAHFHDGSREADFIAENVGAIGRRKDGFGDVEADFSAVDIEGSHHLNIPRAVGADLLVHEAHGGAVGGGAAVKIDPLDERAGTIAHSNDGDSDFSHGKRKSYPEH